MVTFALNKFGSRAIDTIWAWASLKHKSTIASSLSERMAQLNANQFGKFISEKCALSAFKRDQKIWAESIDKYAKRVKEAEDIFSELQGEPSESSEKKSKKKKKNKEEAPVPLEEEMEVVKEEPVKKKKKRELVEEEETIQQEEVTKKKKKHKKNKKDQEVVVEEIPSPQELADSLVESPKKKNKRKRHTEELQDFAATNDSVADESECQPQPEKKKKKKRKSE